jgi:phosphatidylinositol-3-phosphatase
MRSVLVAAMLVIGVSGALAHPLLSRGSGGSTVPADAVPLNRVAVLVLENRSYEQIIGNPSAPYLNKLARRGALATHYYGVTHPSLPNYLALTTGGYQQIKGDCSACRDDGQSLVGQLEAAHISWRAYFESMRHPLSTQFKPGAAYDPHYNPFAYTESLRASDPATDTTSFAALHRDLAARTLPRFAWIAPNVWHDGHNGKLASVDGFARRLVPKIVRALGPHGVLFVTWDEGLDSDKRGADGAGGGRIPLIALGPAARPHTRVGVAANHYALLRTIEGGFHLNALGHAGDGRTPLLTGLLRR